MFLRSPSFAALWLSLGITSLLIFAPTANATLFQNSYVSFELPPSWDCKLDGTEWICVSQYAKQSKEAIILLTAKEMGPNDSLSNYEAKLKTPRQLAEKSGKIVPSKVLQVKQRSINNHPWVDALHLGSEIASYYTRYLATVKDRIAILVTFSAHQEHYTKYSADFLKAVESLRVVAAKDILDAKPSALPQKSNETIGTAISEPTPFEGGEAPPEPNAASDLKTKLLALALLIGAVGFYIWRKKKK
jgi:hypothetical protein